MKEWLDAALELEWKFIIPQPIWTTLGFLVQNYSKILGALVLLMQGYYLYLGIMEKRRKRK